MILTVSWSRMSPAFPNVPASPSILTDTDFESDDSYTAIDELPRTKL